MPSAVHPPPRLDPRRDYRRKFSRLVEEHKKKSRPAWPLFFLFIAMLVIGSVFYGVGQSIRHERPPLAHRVELGWSIENWGVRICGLGFVPAIAGLILAYRARVPCPHCQKDTSKTWSRHCSECGSAQLQHPRFLGTQTVPRCESCGTEAMRNRGGYHYKIHYCPHCGVYLSENGV